MQNQSRPGEGPGPLRFAVLGPGRVGSSFLRRLVASGARLERVSGRRTGGRRTGGRRDGTDSEAAAPWVPVEQLVTDDLDLLLVTVPDPALKDVARELATRPQAPVALHAAGQFDAEILAPLRRAGSAVGSLHPLRAFGGDPAIDDADGTFFAVDGDPPAVATATDLARRFGGVAVPISGRRRELYHLAATLAAGGVATLIAVVEELMAVAELPPTLLDGYLRLTRGALDSIETHGAPVARRITGPAARGDLETLTRQRDLLAEAAPHLLPLVEQLQEETLRRCRVGVAAVDADPDKIPPREGKTE